ncbi:hypothetical protein ABK040_000636 [Willaertia magna]
MSAVTVSTICSLMGSFITILLSLGYLITLIILTIKDEKRLTDINYLPYLIIEYISITIFLIMGFIGLFSLCYCNNKNNKDNYYQQAQSNHSLQNYLFYCSIHWCAWIILSLLIILTLIGINSYHLNQFIKIIVNYNDPNNPTQKEIENYEMKQANILYYGLMVGFTCFLFLCCCIPLAVCGSCRIYVSYKDKQRNKYTALSRAIAD